MRILTFILIIFSFIDCLSQNRSDDIIILAEAFHKYHHTNDIDYSILAKIDNINNPDLIESKVFVSEIIKTDNDILNSRFLKRPDTNTLKLLFIIRAVNHNMFKSNPDNNKTIIERLNSSNIDYHESLVAYYDLIFGSLVNKHASLDLSNTNYDLNDLGLRTPEEKVIFFLVSMERFGSDIWGYMNIPDPNDFESALEIIGRYPKYNDNPYYFYRNFDFKDFKLTVDIRRGKESFKDYYLAKYFEVLKYHIICLEGIRKK